VEGLTLNSYAKLNLYLVVLNKRRDNYHNIQTIFERIDLSDKITLRPRRDKKINIICKSRDLPKDNSQNLAYLSAKLLQDSFNIDRGVDIGIIKRIPVGSGLGGGSSNAAGVLMGLNKLWKLNLKTSKLVSMARDIGSDVPFFIYNTPFAQGKARGDKIKPLALLKKVKLWHILVVPRTKVLTPIIYKEWDKRVSSGERAGLTPPFLQIKKSSGERAGLTRPKYDAKILFLALRKNDLSLLAEALFNSLEQLTAKLYPEVRRIKETLLALGLKSILMSGSGPAIFSIVSSRKEAVSLGRQLEKKDRSWQVFVNRTR
jgi:4-diphosphocytidyl-2-C-methyl-D-erythritol kinase